ncbi:MULTISPECIES: hypothetical protein [Priestia]|uniref:hypothetical protein n=1 Tax=Priestia TaxID=2800373 RepID=UPI00203DB252|nr:MULTISPECIES: hypothetical protein [Priestia]MCM3771400.1 hypothetical protein [Priestia aryabhattai]MDY0943845.1 hypothetical protein [Priestia megaterium]
MRPLILKHYFLTELERYRIESIILNHHLLTHEEILRLDDDEIMGVYHQGMKEDSIITIKQLIELI